MTNPTTLTAIRKGHPALDAVPDTIVIPALGSVRRDQVVKPIEDATLDDIAFAIRGVDAEFNAVADRLYALRKLYGVARQAGALGADRAVESVLRDTGGR